MVLLGGHAAGMSDQREVPGPLSDEAKARLRALFDQLSAEQAELQEIAARVEAEMDPNYQS